MTPTAIIREARADGVSLALSPAGTIKATGDGAAVNRWLAAIREHKAEIIAALKVSPADATRGWWIFYPGGDSISTFTILGNGTYPTRGEVLRDYPGAIDAEAIPEGAE